MQDELPPWQIILLCIFSIISKEFGTSQSPRIDSKSHLCGLFSRNTFLTKRQNMAIWNYTMISLNDHRWWDLGPEGLCFKALAWIWVQAPHTWLILATCNGRIPTSKSMQRATDWTSCWYALEIQLWAETCTRKYAWMTVLVLFKTRPICLLVNFPFS